MRGAEEVNQILLIKSRPVIKGDMQMGEADQFWCLSFETTWDVDHAEKAATRCQEDVSNIL